MVLSHLGALSSFVKSLESDPDPNLMYLKKKLYILYDHFQPYRFFKLFIFFRCWELSIQSLVVSQLTHVPASPLMSSWSPGWNVDDPTALRSPGRSHETPGTLPPLEETQRQGEKRKSAPKVAS